MDQDGQPFDVLSTMATVGDDDLIWQPDIYVDCSIDFQEPVQEREPLDVKWQPDSDQFKIACQILRQSFVYKRAILCAFEVVTRRGRRLDIELDRFIRLRYEGSAMSAGERARFWKKREEEFEQMKTQELALRCERNNLFYQWKIAAARCRLAALMVVQSKPFVIIDDSSKKMGDRDMLSKILYKDNTYPKEWIAWMPKDFI